MERLKKEVVGGWEIKAWLHRFCKHGAGHHSLDSGQRTSERYGSYDQLVLTRRWSCCLDLVAFSPSK